MGRRLTAGIGAVLVLAGLMSACNSEVPATSDAGAPAQVNMGTQPWIGYGPWFIAKARGLDRKHGIDLRLTTFDTDADLSAAFAADHIQVGNVATNTVARYLSAGLKRSIVLFEDTSQSADAIVAGPAIRDVAGLKGKKVAFEEGSTSDILLRYALSTKGLSLSDVKVVHTPASTAGAALAAGQVDSAVTYEPYVSALVSREPKLRLLYTAGEKTGLISDTLAADTQWAKLNAGTVRKLMLVWNDAVADYRANEAEGQRIIATAIAAKPEELATSFKGVRFFDLAESNAFLTGDFRSAAQTLEGILAQTGDAKGAADITASVDVAYGTAAAKGE
jgi:NitT/TauT family transport system substrate-binding protein